MKNEKFITDWVEGLENDGWFMPYPKRAKKDLISRVLEEGDYAVKEIKKGRFNPFKSFWFDGECIYGDDSYITLTEDFAAYTLKLFNPKSIKCESDDEHFHFSFKIGRKTYKASFPSDSDYVDGSYWSLIENAVKESCPDLLMIHRISGTNEELGVVPKELYEELGVKPSKVNKKDHPMLKKYPYLKGKGRDDFDDTLYRIYGMDLIVEDCDEAFDYYLESMGEDIHKPMSNGDFITHVAVSRGFLKKCLEAGIDPHATNGEGKTVLHLCQRKEYAQFLIKDYGLDLYKKDNAGNIPLAYCQDLELANYLIDDCKVDLESKNDEGLTLLFFYLTSDFHNSYSDHRIVVKLIEAGASIESEVLDNPILFYAVNKQQKTPEILQALLERGYDINTLNSKGMSILSHVGSKNEYMMDLLVKHGATLRDEEVTRNEEIIELFIRGKWSEELLQEYIDLGNTKSMAWQEVAEKATPEVFNEFCHKFEMRGCYAADWDRFIEKMIVQDRGDFFIHEGRSYHHSSHLRYNEFKRYNEHLSNCIEMKRFSILVYLLNLEYVELNHDLLIEHLLVV